MTIQQIADKISEKQNAIRALLAKEQPTDEDNTLALTLGAAMTGASIGGMWRRLWSR